MSELTASLSHEISRQPISAAMTNAKTCDGLVATTLTAEDAKAARMVKDVHVRLYDIISRISLLFSKVSPAGAS